MMKLNLTPAMIFIAGIVLGVLLYHWLLKPEVDVKYVETIKIETDTVDLHYKEKYMVDSIARISLSDSIKFYKTKYSQKLRDANIILVPESEIKAPIHVPLKNFSGQQSFLYGNTFFSAVVAGELLEMNLTNDFKIPSITNTITKTETTTITKKPRGLYIGAGVNQQLSPFGTVHYLDKQYIFSGSYGLDRSISVSVAKKLF